MIFPSSTTAAPRARRLVTGILVAAFAAAGLVAGTLADPGSALAAGPLPACRYDDIMTTPRTYSDWSEILVDTILRIPKSYVPPDLTPVSAAGIGGSGKVRAIVIPDLAAMTAAAKANGTPIGVQSAYRSYTTQESTFQSWVNTSGYKQARLYSARPGHSEHQLGLAIDFKSAAGGPPWSGTDWGTSPAGSWMKQHAWQYGFIQSYPKGKVSKTCYDYESWHFRYVGIAEAAAIHASGLTLREYLWQHFTTTVVPNADGSIPSQPPSADPSVSPSVEPSEPASVSPSPDPGASASDAPSPSPAPGAPGTATASPDPGGGLAPVGTVFGLDPTAAAVGVALAVVALALIGSLALGRRRRGRKGPGLSG